MLGWSVNLSTTDPGDVFEIDLPVPPLFESSQGPVIEVVFWSHLAERWVHGVSFHFERTLPPGHVQLALGDLVWLRRVVDRDGVNGLRECVHDLEISMVPSAEVG